jgi:DinB superfamily
MFKNKILYFLSNKLIMDKKQIINQLKENHNIFLKYLNGLNTKEYNFKINQKWNAEQHLGHIILSVKAINRVFLMEKTAIENTFGTAEISSRTYEVITAIYKEKTGLGALSPEQFIPKSENRVSRAEAETALVNSVENLGKNILNFTETELDKLCIPHPLLGKITLREMLYNAIYHVQHHEELIKKQLQAIDFKKNVENLGKIA